MDVYRVVVQRTTTYVGVVMGENPNSWDRSKLADYIDNDGAEVTNVRTETVKVVRMTDADTIYEKEAQ